MPELRIPVDEASFASYVKDSAFDHIDFGCSTGGSLQFARKFLGGERGLGIDIDAAKVERTRAAGFDALVYDLNDIPDRELVNFTLLSHFLEHVPDMRDVRAFIRKACVISSQFVYIQQPFFDADGYLARHGLKLYWSDWRGHPNRMTSLEMWLILRDLQAAGVPITFSLFVRNRIKDSADDRVHSLMSPEDQHAYDPARHPHKPEKLVFTDDVFAELVCLITKRGVDHAALRSKLVTGRDLVEINNGGWMKRRSLKNMLGFGRAFGTAKRV